MRKLASGVFAVLVPLGVLMGLGQSIHATRPDLGASPRSTSLDSSSLDPSHAVATPGAGLTDRATLPAPRPSFVVRVLTLDLSDPWQPEPQALRPPAWSGTRERDVVALDDYVYALRGYGETGFPASADPRWDALSDRDLTVAFIDHYAYVPAGDAGLWIFDYTAPASEHRERWLATPGAAEGVLVSGNRAHVAVVQHVPAYSGYD